METQELIQTMPKKRKSKFKVIFLPIIAAIVVFALLTTALFFILSSAKTYIMAWGPKEITFYSQLPIESYNDDEFFENGNIDGGFNDSVYKGSYNYSKYKNNKLKIESQIGIAESAEWSADPMHYLGDDPSSINTQYDNGAKTIVTSGFNLVSVFEKMYSGDFSNEDGQTYTDADFEENGWQAILMDDDSLAMNHKTATSVYFKGADAGFLAGIAASIYTTSTVIENSLNSKTELVNDDIVTWGGASLPSVYNILSGFEQGINYFNYRILGVDVNNVLYDATANETIGLINASGTSDTDLLDGLDMTNGFSLTPDYTKKFANTNGNDVTAENYNSNWYAGGFDSGDYGYPWTIQRALNSVNNNVALTFPVAGGQYLDVTNYFVNNEPIDSMVIGVDVDGTKADPAGAEYYLGSATKNLTDSTAAAIWASEWKDDTSAKQTTFGEVNTSDFISENTEENPLGWKVEEVNGVVPEGDLYQGTFENNGVGFVEGLNNGGSTALEASYDYLTAYLLDNGFITSIPEELDSFEEFSLFAYNDNIDNVGMIESASNTFTPKNLAGVNTTSSIMPWIPNWTNYQSQK